VLVLLLLFLEPPHFRQRKQYRDPHHSIREVPPKLRRNVGGAVAPVRLAAPEDPPEVDLVGVLRDKAAAHVDQLEIGADQAVGIQARRLSALVAHLDADGRRVVLLVGASAIDRMRIGREEPLPLVPAVVADKFSAHGVGEDVRAAIIVTGDPAAGTILSSRAARETLPSKGTKGRVRKVVWRSNFRAATVLFVGYAHIAEGHAVALLAPETGKGFVVVVVAVVAKPRIEDLAAVAALLVLFLGVTLWTASFCFRVGDQ